MRLLTKSVMTFAAAVFVSIVGFVAHVTAQPTMTSMHHGDTGSSSVSCATLCNSAPVSSKEKDSDSEKVNDDTLPPLFIATTDQGIQASSLEYDSVSRYITTLEPPPLNVRPYILFAVFRT